MNTSQGAELLKMARLCQVRDVTKYVPGVLWCRFGIDMPSAAKAALFRLDFRHG